MYEEAIILGLSAVSLLFAYIASIINEDRAGIIKILFLFFSAVNGWITINICATMAEAEGDAALAKTIWENSNVLCLVVLFAAGLWLFSLFILWVLSKFFPGKEGEVLK